jgi:hypothetical protein
MDAVQRMLIVLVFLSVMLAVAKGEDQMTIRYSTSLVLREPLELRSLMMCPVSSG